MYLVFIDVTFSCPWKLEREVGRAETGGVCVCVCVRARVFLIPVKKCARNDFRDLFEY